MHLNHTYTIN